MEKETGGTPHARGHRRLDRHHRQILGGGRGARAGRVVQGPLLGLRRPRSRRTTRPTCSSRPHRRARRQTIDVTTHVFAGAKETDTINKYETEYGIKNFGNLIDWGWFYFITKPLFQVLDFFYRLTGNFGVAILIVTVLIKGLFFPLANKSYMSMAKMKRLQPQMAALKERFPDDKQKQQEATMELYKRRRSIPWRAACRW